MSPIMKPLSIDTTELLLHSFKAIRKETLQVPSCLGRVFPHPRGNIFI